MLSCKDVTRLLSAAQDHKLTLAERVRLQLHLMMCKGCANFKKQMVFLREASRQFAAKSSGQDHRD